MIVEEKIKFITCKQKKRIVLFNISNHPSDKWNKDQRDLFNIIIDIPFPVVKSDFQQIDLYFIAKELKYKMQEWIKKFPDTDFFLYIAGEYSLVVTFLMTNMKFLKENIKYLVYPITKRIVEEKEDGTTIRKFVFKGWRLLKYIEEV